MRPVWMTATFHGTLNLFTVLPIFWDVHYTLFTKVFIIIQYQFSQLWLMCCQLNLQCESEERCQVSLLLKLKIIVYFEEPVPEYIEQKINYCFQIFKSMSSETIWFTNCIIMMSILVPGCLHSLSVYVSI